MNREERYYFTPDSVREYISMSEGFDGSCFIHKLDEYLDKTSHILELGSGPGRDLAILNRKYQVTGSDISPYFIEYCKNNMPEAEILLLDAVSIDTDRSFDAIFSNKVLQHFTDKEILRSVQRQAEILNKG